MDAAAHEVFLERRCERDDRRGPPVEEQLERFHQPQKKAFLHSADGDDRRRPDVSQFEDEGRPAHCPDQPTGDGSEELRRGRADDVGLRLEESRGDAGEQEAQEVERAQQRAAVGRDEGLDADDLDAGGSFGPVPAVPVARVELALREVRRRRDHRHVVAPLGPVAGALVDPGRGGVRLGREILGEEEDFKDGGDSAANNGHDRLTLSDALR